MLCHRGEDIVKRMRAILDKNQHDPDQYLKHTSIKSDEPYLADLGGSYARHLQHDQQGHEAHHRSDERGRGRVLRGGRVGFHALR